MSLRSVNDRFLPQKHTLARVLFANVELIGLITNFPSDHPQPLQGQQDEIRYNYAKEYELQAFPISYFHYRHTITRSLTLVIVWPGYHHIFVFLYVFNSCDDDNVVDDYDNDNVDEYEDDDDVDVADDCVTTFSECSLTDYLQEILMANSSEEKKLNIKLFGVELVQFFHATLNNKTLKSIASFVADSDSI
ncbi:hypothetical protein FF38_04467 [Lucilia cuprina]|uniref:Uncharacterized protein n=1 Tax=Lucilia cuprina TaxID=7375 RepID=A0A0L0CFC9_LUCCU|nr:hypothetical protein FF38_04467 [Lucilia cuprina]